MQLGVRWQAGDPPHRSVPSTLHAAILAAESNAPHAQSWTLTWLEGRPRAALDDAVLVYVDAAGQVHAEAPTSEVAEELDDDSWLD